jgi:Phage integrase, N-terminal SAM-like domain
MSQLHPVPAGRQLPRGHLLVLNRSFRRTLEAENKSPRTIEAYTDAVRLLATYCQAHGSPLLAGELRRGHIQAFIADQLARWKPATAHNRYLRVREGHRLAYLPQVWVGRNGPMTPSGINQVVHDRARVAGWKSRTMIGRYAKATAVERARASHARLSPGDRL